MAKIKNKLTDEDRMMILRNEIRLSEIQIEDIIKPSMEESLRRYTGTDVPPGELDIVLNEVYPIIQYELPAIMFKVPRAFLKPRTKTYIARKKNIYTGKMEDTIIDANRSAKTQEHILNYTIDQIKYKEQLRKTLLDALLFKYGAMWHGYKGDFGMTDEKSIYIQNEKVFVKRLRPDRVLFDPKVTLANIDEAEWVGRSFDIPLRDVLEDDKLNVNFDTIQGVDGFGNTLNVDNPFLNNGGQDKVKIFGKRRTMLDHTEKEFRKVAQFITIYEIFRKPSVAERQAGKKGEVLLLTESQKEPLRKSVNQYKNDGSPLKILMFNDVPDAKYGMSDVEVYGPIADHKNLIINMQLRNAESNSKTMTFFDKSGMEEEEIQKIEGGDQNIIGVEGPVSGKVVMVSPSGQASSELYLIDGRIQANLDEKSGVNDLKKGSMRSGEESATSVRIRNAGSSARPAYRQDIMADFLKDSFKFLNDLNQQYMPIKDAVRITGSLDIEWSENPTKEEIQADVDVEIDVISMLPESPEKEIETNQFVLSLMTDAVNNPGIMAKLQEEGKKFNISPVIEQLLYRLKIRSPEVFRNIRPDESMGMASVSELRAAEENIKAIVGGAPELPSPPAEGQQHQTRLGAYVAQQQILKLQGQVNEVLEALIQVQAQIAEQEQKKEAPRSGDRLKSSKQVST